MTFLSALIFFVSISAQASDFSMGTPTVEMMTAPQGIDILTPSFGWKLYSKTNGEKQSAYQIRVWKAEGKEVWNSGKTVSDRQTFIRYAGQTLEPGTSYKFEVTVWNGSGQKSAKAESSFSTGLWPTAADPQPWKGKWIGLESQQSAEQKLIAAEKASWIAFTGGLQLPVGRSCYRFAFEANPADLTEAGLAFTGDNSCKVYLNGEEVFSQGDFKKIRYFEVLARLKKGRNVVAVEANNTGEGPNPGGIIGGIILKKNGTIVAEYYTSEQWKANSRSESSYFAPNFNDSDWKNAVVVARYGQGPWGALSVTTVDTKSLPARYLSRNVELKGKKIKRACVYLVGLGYYELFLNENKVGDHVLDPVLTEFEKRVASNCYDVTDQLQQTGRDLNISVVLGSGRYFPPRDAQPKMKGYGWPKLLFQLEVEYSDGTKQLVISDENWKISDAGPIQANNDYDGEIYDASRAQYGMPIKGAFYEKLPNGPFYSVITDKPVQIVAAPEGKPVAQMMEPMRITGEIKPISLKEVRPGIWVYDFGQNFVGWCRLNVKGEKGTAVQMRFAELINKNGAEAGMLYTANLRSAKCRDIYYLAGSPKGETYSPRFTYHGFRYVELTGYPGKPDLDTLTGCVVGTDLKITGSFECSNSTVTRFVKNIEWGTRGNYLSIPTDCPQRDERQGWQGDRAAESKGEMFLFNNITLYRKWMQDIEDTQRADGNVSDVAPSYWKLYGSNVTWPSAQSIVPWSLYLMFGDDTAIRKHYASRKKWLAHLAGFIKPNGTIDKDNYGDWCVPPEEQHLIHSKDPARKTNKGLLATSYYIYNLRLAQKFAEILGITKDAEEFKKNADKMTADFNKVFYNAKEGKYDNGTQTSSVLPLAFDLVPDKEKPRVLQTLVRNINEITKGHVGTGLIGAQWLNRTLTAYGRGDLSWGFATTVKFPSWGYMLENGATTVWELWNGDTADPAMNSGNHVMLVGDLAIWLFEDLAAIKADETNPGFKNIIMKPHLVGDLTMVNAKYESVRGPISSSWTLDPKSRTFDWKVQIPVNSTAKLYIPAKDLQSVKIKNFTTEKKIFRDNRVEIELPSGSWSITSVCP